MGSKVDVNIERRVVKKHCFSERKIRFFENSPLDVNIDFWSHFCANLAPFWHPKYTKIHPKIDSKRHQKIDQFWYRFFIDFGSVLGSNLDPCWPPFSAQDGPRGLQNPSKTTQDASKNALDGLRQPKMPPNLPRSPLDLDFGASRPGFWKLFDAILIHFWMVLGSFLICKILAARWRARRSAALWIVKLRVV